MTSPAFGIWVTTPILRSVTSAPENPTKDLTVALAGVGAVTNDLETPLLLAEIATCTDDTTASENPTKDPTVAFAGAAAVTGDPETPRVLAGNAACTGDTTASENPTKGPTVAFAGAAAVASDPEISLVLAGNSTGTGDPVHCLGLPLELSPTAHGLQPFNNIHITPTLSYHLIVTCMYRL